MPPSGPTVWSASTASSVIASALDVVHPGAGPLGLAAGDVGDCRIAEGGPQRLHPLVPDASGLLALLAENPIEGLDDLEDVDLVCGAGERVAALGAAVADQDARAAQGREELLEELDGDAAALGDLADRHRALAGARQLRQRDHRVT